MKMKKLLAAAAVAALSVCLIVSAAFADEGSAVVLDKTAKYNSSTGMVDITLESYTTGIVEEGKALPADTVLVLDTSGSMAYDYKLTRVGTPMYGDYFHHSSGDYWGWLLNGHLIDGKNPYVLLPNGSFAEAEYHSTDANNVEIFRVKGTSTYFYPKMQTENLTKVPRANVSYPVYQLYSSTAENTYIVETGVPMFGERFTYAGVTYYGWLQDTHGEPYVRLEDGTFGRAYYSRTDKNSVEVFKYTDNDTGAVYEFYPRLVEKHNGVARAEDLPVVQLYSGHNKTRMAALHDAVAEFLRLTAEKNEGLAESEQNKVSLVQFSCDQHGGTAPTKKLKDLTAITMDNVDEWISFVYGITDGGAHTHTEIGEGMLLAEDIIGDVTRASHKAVIAFTDGKPECDVTSGGGYSYTETNKAIAAANRMTKNGADIYSICIQDHARVNAGQPLPPDEGKGVNDDANNINRFMHLLSSNYPDATDMTNTGSGSTDAGYYMVPGGDDDLTDIFTHIGDQIGTASIDLGSNAYVLDQMTPYFEIPKGTDVSIDVKDAVYSDGKLSWKNSSMNKSGISYSIDSDKDTLLVTGFDYNHNFVASTGRTEGDIAKPGDFYGRKLVVKFSAPAVDGFLGGDNIVTNEASLSGIYGSDGTMVKPFPVPDVDIQVKEIDPKITSKDIYLSQMAALPEVAGIGEFKVGNTVYQVDGINNGYVDIVYTVKDESGKSMSYTIPAGTAYSGLTDLKWDDEGGLTSTHPVLLDDEKYTVTCKVTSTNNSKNTVSKDGEAAVKVYKPVITFEDSEIKIGETPDYREDNLTGVVWKHGEKSATESMGAAPELAYSYSPEAAAFMKETNVKTSVTAKKDGTKVPANMDVTAHTTFYREACNIEGCPHTSKSQVSSADDGRVNFVVHVGVFDLVINKSGISQPVDDDFGREITADNAEYQSVIFSVSRDDNRDGKADFTMDVVVHIDEDGKGSVTIKDLPASVNPYTVKEKTDWSWRYTPAKSEVVFDSSKDLVNGKYTAEFANERTNQLWLNGDNYAQNLFDALSENK